MGQGSTNMDTKLGMRHLTNDMQDLLFIIRDNVRSKEVTQMIPYSFNWTFQSVVEYFMKSFLFSIWF